MLAISKATLSGLACMGEQRAPGSVMSETNRCRISVFWTVRWSVSSSLSHGTRCKEFTLIKEFAKPQVIRLYILLALLVWQKTSTIKLRHGRTVICKFHVSTTVHLFDMGTESQLYKIQMFANILP